MSMLVLPIQASPWSSDGYFHSLLSKPLLGCAGPAGVSMIVAVGPFTLSEDLHYAPLAALLAVCRQRRPDALVLLGPFVDAEHPLLGQGAVDLTFEDIFESQVGTRAISTACLLLLVPHQCPHLGTDADLEQSIVAVSQEHADCSALLGWCRDS